MSHGDQDNVSLANLSRRNMFGVSSTLAAASFACMASAQDRADTKRRKAITRSATPDQRTPCY